MEIDKLNKINSAVNEILDSERPWSDAEFKFYKMLEDKVLKYETKAKAYSLNKADKSSILSNIKEQPWLDTSRHKHGILCFIKKMDIVFYEYSTSDLESKLKLKITIGNNYSFNIKYIRTTKSLRYFMYFENESLRGNICYLDTTKNKDKQEDIKLPDFKIIDQIISSKKGANKLDNYDIIHLASELLLYYDENGEISQATIGMNYPITLVQLANMI